MLHAGEAGRRDRHRHRDVMPTIRRAQVRLSMFTATRWRSLMRGSRSRWRGRCSRSTSRNRRSRRTCAARAAREHAQVFDVGDDGQWGSGRRGAETGGGGRGGQSRGGGVAGGGPGGGCPAPAAPRWRCGCGRCRRRDGVRDGRRAGWSVRPRPSARVVEQRQLPLGLACCGLAAHARRPRVARARQRTHAHAEQAQPARQVYPLQAQPPAACRIARPRRAGRQRQAHVARHGAEVVEAQLDADRAALVAIGLRCRSLARRSTSSVNNTPTARRGRPLRMQVAVEGGFAAHRHRLAAG